MNDQPDPRRHERTRRDHRTETAEDYVEAVADLLAERSVCRVVDLARHFAVSHVTVSKIVSRLKAEGFLASEPYGPVELTGKGQKLAKASKKRHQIVVGFLLAIGVSPDIAELDAEGMEHHVSTETLKKLAAFSRRETTR